MNKAELIAAIAAETGMTKVDSEKALKAVIGNISAAVAKGDSVQLIGFGTFSVKAKPARTCRNPRTGETMKVAAKKVPVFKAGKALCEATNAPAKKSKKK